jgi:hypothetical protein
LTWEALAKKRIHIWLPSQFEVCKAQMCPKFDRLQFASAGMIPHLGSNGWTSTLIHKTSKREEVDRSGNATKREDLRCCTLDGSLRTTRPHAKNENPLNNNNNKARDYSRTSWSDGLRL